MTEGPPAEPHTPLESGPVVRPFIITGGRTRPVDARLRLETLVTAPPSALAAPLTLELHRIVRMCQRPVSVAEIANGMGSPVGVARVLVADLLADRLVTVHEHTVPGDSHAALALLERIRDGVRAL
jgi:hypothetical protein